MDPVARRVLKVCKEDIKKNLLVNEDILDKLEEDDTLTEEMAQSVRAERTPCEKINTLLYILQRRGPSAFQTFISAIRKDFEFLAKRLEEKYTEESKVHIPSDQQTTSSETTQFKSNTDKPSVVHLDANNNGTASYSIEISEPAVSSNANSDVTDHTATKPTPVQEPSYKEYTTSFMHHKLFDMNDTIQSSKTDNSLGAPNPDFQQNLNSLYTKLKTHLTNKGMRELSFDSPKPVSFDMVHALLDELLDIEEKCYRVLGATDRSASLVTHVIELTTSKRKLRSELKQIDDQRNKYAEKIIKLEDTIRRKADTKQKIIKENKKLVAELEVTKEKIEEMTDLLQEASNVLEQKEATEAEIQKKLEDVENQVKELEQKLVESTSENERLKTELSIYKQKHVKNQDKWAFQLREKPRYPNAEENRNAMKGKLQLSVGTKRLCGNSSMQMDEKTSNERKEMKFEDGTDMTDEEKQKVLKEQFEKIQNCNRTDPEVVTSPQTKVNSLQYSNRKANVNMKGTIVLDTLGINISPRKEKTTATKIEVTPSSPRRPNPKANHQPYRVHKQTRYHHIK